MQRYKLRQGKLRSDPAGDWVRWEDVKQLRERLEAIHRDFSYNLKEQQAGRLTSFKMVLVQIERLLQAAEANGGDDA